MLDRAQALRLGADEFCTIHCSISWGSTQQVIENAPAEMDKDVGTTRVKLR